MASPADPTEIHRENLPRESDPADGSGESIPLVGDGACVNSVNDHCRRFSSRAAVHVRRSRTLALAPESRRKFSAAGSPETATLSQTKPSREESGMSAAETYWREPAKQRRRSEREGVSAARRAVSKRDASGADAIFLSLWRQTRAGRNEQARRGGRDSPRWTNRATMPLRRTANSSH